MSHFTVMVIGSNPEEQLAPYDENIKLETPVVTGEVSDEEKNSMIDYYKKTKNGGLDLPFDELYAEKGYDWNGNRFEKRDDKWVEILTYNPKSKWDWYQLGGRWSNFLKLKEGTTGTHGEKSWMNEDTSKPGYCDQTIKGNIDVEGMRNEAGEKAGKYYDEVMEYIKDTPPHIKWKDFIKRVENNEILIDQARTDYNAQPRIVAVSTKKLGWMVNVDEFDVTKEEYIQDARNTVLSTYAILKNGEWFQKGKMGWWGMSSDEMTQSEWNTKVAQMFDELPEDTLISIVDCHI